MGEQAFGVAVMSENSLWNPFLMSHEHTFLEDIEDNRLTCPKKLFCFYKAKVGMGTTGNVKAPEN